MAKLARYDSTSNEPSSLHGTPHSVIDQKLLVIIGLLVATVVAYLAGLTPYPIGWFVLSVLLAMRIGQLWRERGRRKGNFQA